MTKTGARSGEEVTLPRTRLQPMRLPLHGDVIQLGESQMTETVVGLCGRLAFSLGRIFTLLKDVPWRASELAQWAKHLATEVQRSEVNLRNEISLWPLQRRQKERTNPAKLPSDLYSWSSPHNTTHNNSKQEVG